MGDSGQTGVTMRVVCGMRLIAGRKRTLSEVSLDDLLSNNLGRGWEGKRWEGWTVGR